jgi:hypothetical protein
MDYEQAKQQSNLNKRVITNYNLENAVIAANDSSQINLAISSSNDDRDHIKKFNSKIKTLKAENLKFENLKNNNFVKIPESPINNNEEEEKQIEIINSNSSSPKHKKKHVKKQFSKKTISPQSSNSSIDGNNSKKLNKNNKNNNNGSFGKIMNRSPNKILRYT